MICVKMDKKWYNSWYKRKIEESTADLTTELDQQQENEVI